MLFRKELEFKERIRKKLLQESAIVPYIVGRTTIQQNNPKPPITEQPADTVNSNSPWNVDPNDTIEDTSGKILDKKKDNMKDLDKYKTDIYGYIIEDLAVIPAGSDDLEQLAQVGLQSNTPATYIVRDKNTGQFKGGLSIDVDPETGEKTVKAVDVDQDADNLRKVLIHLAQTPEGSFLVKKKVNVEIAKDPEDVPDTIDMDDDQDYDNDQIDPDDFRSNLMSKFKDLLSSQNQG